MGNQNDYTDGIALSLTVLIVIFMYFVYEPLMDYLVYVWYGVKYPLFVGLSMLPDIVRETLYSFTKLPSYISPNLGFDLNQNILDIAIYFKEKTFDQIYMTEMGARTDIILYVNSKTPYVLLPISLPILYMVSNKIIKKQRYISVFSIKTLGIQEAEIWPQIQPVIYDYQNFIDTKSLDDDWFAMSPKIVTYFNKNDLLHYYKNENEEDIENYGELRFKIKEEEMHKFFVKEMGSPWTGIKNMSQEKKCILAIILPKIMREKETEEGKEKQGLSREINDQLARAYSGVRNIEKNGKITKDKKHKEELEVLKKIAFNKVDKILERYFPEPVEKKGLLGKIIGRKGEIIQKPIPEKIKLVIDSHFYEKVIFAAFLSEARKTGVLASCEFIWLKKENRDLWYIMSQTGRTACFCETAGAWSHYLAEKKLGRKIATPMVQKAIDASDKYLFETHTNYDPIGDFEED